MKASPACIDLIKSFESLKLESYLCPAGIPTIGYGHTQGVELGQTIDADEAERLLAHDVEQFEAAVIAAVPRPLTQGQFDALVSFAYNCKGWRTSTLIRLTNLGNVKGAALEFPKWVHAGEKILPGLVRRRAAEQKLFLT